MTRFYAIDLPAAPFTSVASLVPVDGRSSERLRVHVERFARYFLRELHTGGLQFEASESEKSPDYVPYKAFLFSWQGHNVGASCFRYRKDLDSTTPWFFDWIWIHPFCRRRGVLSQCWKDLKGHVGEFQLSRPVSVSMQTFLLKVGESAA
jgi:hypothetical protein